jgi:ABC-type transport system involved in multi-copper enzyme maturation permease subunit
MRQTLAIFLDAYRELNSRKLFWISLSISLAVVLALALPTQTERGFSVFGAKLEGALPFSLIGSRAVSASAFYKFIYSWMGVNLWLGWGSTILALISTASMIPELVTSGSIELTLAKPIGRVRLFLTKYVAGLLFVGLQAAVFALGALVVIGIRSGVWDPRPLLIIPIMMVFFSFLHCMSVLVGLLTRSTLMSLLAVLLVWLFIWSLGTVENVFLAQVDGSERQVARLESQEKTFRDAVEGLDAKIHQLQQLPNTASPPPASPKDSSENAGEGQNGSRGEATAPAEAGQPARGDRGRRLATSRLLAAGKQLLDAATDQDVDSLKSRRAVMQAQLDSLAKDLAVERDSLATTRRWHGYLYAVYTVLPKTGETKDLFQRWAIDKSDWAGFLKILDQFADNGGRPDAQDSLNKRPLWWILGTSLAFEAVILGIAGLIFARRDF